MSSSVGFTFLLLLSLCHSWQLPLECRPPSPRPPHNPLPNDNITTTTTLPTPDPTHSPTHSPSAYTASPTTSPTKPYDEACCEAIKSKYKYDPDTDDSTCGSLHQSVDSCILNSYDRIETIHLRNCSLDGTMPNEFSAMTELKTLDLRDNAISGYIPPYFNNYKLFAKLQRLYIANNNFLGLIPFNLFQYPQLRYIDFQQNRNLMFNITALNLTDSPALTDKPAIAANFSFLNVILVNNTDSTFYIFLEKLRFSQFSMRSSINNFSFIWQNTKTRNTFHTIHATETFDVFGNNITGEFPCHFKSAPGKFYIAENGIQNTNITCYKSKPFETLMIFQKQNAYMNQSKCYADFSGWATTNDHKKYCMFIQSDLAPLALKDCCNIPPPTREPTKEPENENIASAVDWFLHNIEWFVLLLISVFVIVIFIIWKQKKKTRNQQQIEIGKRVPRTAKLSTNKDTESLLYGDF
eukprot:301832_1